jgi:hypothetical protein
VNKSQGYHGSRNRLGGKYELARAEGEASDDVAWCEGSKGVGKGSEEPRGPGGCARRPRKVVGASRRSGRGVVRVPRTEMCTVMSQRQP